MDWLTDPEAWIALLTLTALEIVLGIDNIVFVTVMVGRLPERERKSARIVGLGLAMVTRILLLLTLAWALRLSSPLFRLFDHPFSGRDLILIAGGLFLLAKSTHEIHGTVEGDHERRRPGGRSAFVLVVIEIGILDLVFSLDSVITAVGMAKDIPVMVIAIVIAVLVMMAAAGTIGRFIEKHPTLKILALSFLVLIGIALVAEGLRFHIPKGYIYFAMAFSVGVEMLNMRRRSRADAGAGA